MKDKIVDWLLTESLWDAYLYSYDKKNIGVISFPFTIIFLPFFLYGDIKYYIGWKYLKTTEKRYK